MKLSEQCLIHSSRNVNNIFSNLKMFLSRLMKYSGGLVEFSVHFQGWAKMIPGMGMDTPDVLSPEGTYVFPAL